MLCAIGEEKNEGLSLARDMKLENSIVEVRQQLIDSRSKTTINKGDVLVLLALDTAVCTNPSIFRSF